jgi:nicotinamidase-related amidase
MSEATALIVIDAQESFRQRPIWFETETASYLKNQQALIDGARAKGMKIVRILHAEPEGIFSQASGFVKPLAEITLTPDAEFIKTRHSALVGTGLEIWLIENGIRRIIVSGIRTEQCCETTTRHASDIGYEVDYVTEATLTFAMTDANGVTFSQDDIKTRTELVLAGRFARIATVSQALTGPAAKAAA